MFSSHIQGKVHYWPVNYSYTIGCIVFLETYDERKEDKDSNGEESEEEKSQGTDADELEDDQKQNSDEGSKIESDDDSQWEDIETDEETHLWRIGSINILKYQSSI